MLFAQPFNPMHVSIAVFYVYGLFYPPFQSDPVVIGFEFVICPFEDREQLKSEFCPLY
jgi:hypothetical protein